MSVKTFIKRFIPLLPFLKTKRSYHLELRREYRLPPKNENLYHFGKAEYARDFKEIIEMFHLSFVAYQGVKPEEKESFLQKRFDNNIPCFVVRNDRQLTGFVWLVHQSTAAQPPLLESYAVTNLFVAEPFRGQGLAKQLLLTAADILFSEIDAAKIVSTVLEHNTASLQTHLKANFTIAGINKIQHIGRFSLEKFVPLNSKKEINARK